MLICYERERGEAGGREMGGIGGVGAQRESREGGTERGAETGGRGGAQVRVGRKDSRAGDG